MFYILRTTSPRLENYWGLNAIGAFKTEAEASAFARKKMEETPERLHLIMVKATKRWNTAKVQLNEEDLNDTIIKSVDVISTWK